MVSEFAQILGASALFKDFTPTGLELVASIAEDRRLPAGAPLFVEQMLGDGLFVIAEGSILLTVRGPSGGDLVLTSLGPGESLGEVAVLRSSTRLCSARAEVSTRVLEIARRDLSALQRSKPQAAMKLMIAVVECVAERTGHAGDDLRAFLAWRSTR